MEDSRRAGVTGEDSAGQPGRASWRRNQVPIRPWPETSGSPWSHGPPPAAPRRPLCSVTLPGLPVQPCACRGPTPSPALAYATPTTRHPGACPGSCHPTRPRPFDPGWNHSPSVPGLPMASSCAFPRSPAPTRSVPCPAPRGLPLPAPSPLLRLCVPADSLRTPPLGSPPRLRPGLVFSP